PGSRRSWLAWSPQYLLIVALTGIRKTRRVPQVPEEDDEVVVRIPRVDRRAQVDLHLLRQRELDAGVVGRVEREVDVLLHERRGERGREVVPHQRLGLVLDKRRTHRGTPHHVEEHRTRDAGGFSEDERL